MKRLLPLFLSVISSISFACSSMPENLSRSHASVVKEANAIYVVEALAQDSSAKSCNLKIIKKIKGSVPTTEKLGCRQPENGDWMTNYKNHTEEAFWGYHGGRLGIKSNCTIIPAAFSPGKKYLVLQGIEPDIKQYEEIGDEEDKWLKFVIAEAKK